MSNELTNQGPEGLIQMIEAAKVLAKSPLLPEHLRGLRKSGTFKPYDAETVAANVLLVMDAARVFQAESIFMLATDSYVVGGSLDFSGKAYAAVANQSGYLAGDLNCTYSGEGNDLSIRVFGTLRGETEPRVADMHILTAKAAGGSKYTPEWDNNPRQQLWYAGARQWVRRHLSKALLTLGPKQAPEPSRAVTEPQAETPLLAIPPTTAYLDSIAELEAASALHQVKKIVLDARGRRGMTPEEREKLEAKARTIWDEMAEEVFLVFDQRLGEAAGDRNQILQVMADVDDSDLMPKHKKELADRAKVISEGVA